MNINDPHVRAINYFIGHDDRVDYRDAAPLSYESDLFHVQADKGQVILEPKNHYATEEEAKEAVEGFVRRWEFESALRVGSAAFKMMYAGVDIIDRNPPPPGVVPISGTFRSRPVRMQARLPKRVSEYPSPHSGRPIEPDHPDALFMLSRLDLYRQRREPLASVAYICLTVLEGSAAPGVRGRDQRRAKTAGYYRIEKKILDVVGALSSEKGGCIRLQNSALSETRKKPDDRPKKGTPANKMAVPRTWGKKGTKFHAPAQSMDL